MNEPRTYVLALSPEAQELLAENGVDLTLALREQGLDVKRGQPPADAPVSQGEKEIVLALLASGIAVSMIASAVVKILDSLGRNKKFLVTEHEMAPAQDAAGKLITDPAGKPLMRWSEKKRLLEANQTTQENSSLSLEVSPTLLKVSLSSGR